ncbi:MAG TPA: ParA family protein [Pyrinomonadaceae bacterium]|jgi:cellulose biosynthesis protein BcsQ|nr:ParA family protein [Pyrinomonadaceae bacterium]
MMNNLDKLLERFKIVAEGGEVERPTEKFTTYAITNFRGGIGKSTLAFNLAYEVSRTHKSLLLDLCPQTNFSQSLLGEDAINPSLTIYDALLSRVMAGTASINMDDLLVSVPPSCGSFKFGQGVHIVPGSKELFLFPSLLYTQLSATAQLGSKGPQISKNILESVKLIIETLRGHLKAEKVLIDTSPFFGGATHLGWVAADALIIPVRVDQHSMDALKLTLSMLRNPDMDFLRLNKQAGIGRLPKIHAIAMTHCGWNRQSKFTPDRSTQAYLSQVIEIAEDNKDLFSSDDPINAIHILDDFHSAGRISGTKRIPLAKLNNRESYTIESQRLEVNESIDRYKNEMRSLALTI